MTVKAEPSHQYPVTYCCHATEDLLLPTRKLSQAQMGTLIHVADLHLDWIRKPVTLVSDLCLAYTRQIMPINVAVVNKPVSNHA